MTSLGHTELMETDVTPVHKQWKYISYVDGLMQKRCNSSVLAMELHLSLLH